MTLLAANLVDYEGRSVDYLLLDRASDQQDLSGFGQGDLYSQALVIEGSQGALIAGPVKAAQRFLLELLTPLGSIPALPHRGCLFMLQATAGLWRTAADVSSSFSQSMIIVRRNLIQEESNDDPDDERFGDASIISVSVTRDLTVLQLRFKTRAGDTRVIKYPLRIRLTR